MSEVKTSIPLVVIGVGALITFYNPANLRFAGYFTIAAGVAMLAIKRS
jgi:hypothetical protein|tara:strand:+ start:137 stop:280 length:144 start_codon:yes stop_codon:yes gene_type:complete